jgi:limonene-1,2-epoxide hydrolase
MPDDVRNREAIEAFWRAYNQEALDDCIKIYAPEARLRHFSQGIDVSGRDGIRELMQAALAAVPGRRSHLVNIVSTGGTVVTENHFEGKLAATGQAVVVDMCYVFQFVDGKVMDQREYA